MYILEDGKKEWTFEQVSSPSFTNKFIKNTAELPLNLNTFSAYWGKLVIENKSNLASDWVMEFPDQRMDRVELYIPDSNNHYQRYSCGDGMPFYQRIYNHKNCVFQIPNTRDRIQTYYFRVEAENVGTFTTWIRSDKHFKYYAFNEYITLGLYYGIIVIMVVLNFSLFLSIRDRSYIYYALYVISIGLFSLFQNGIGFQYLWPNMPELNNNGRSFGIFSLVIWQLMYTRSFLNLQRYAPFINKLIIFFLIIRVAIFLIGYFFSEPLFLYLPIDNVPLFLSFLAGIMAYRNGFKSARFFLLGFSMLFFGFVVHSLANIGLIPNGIITVYAHDIGGSLEMIFLSLAFADKLKMEKSGKEIAQSKILEELRRNDELKSKIIKQLIKNDIEEESVNKELEEKVKERTVEVSLVNDQLKQHLEEISRINTMLKSQNDDLKENITEIESATVTNKQIGKSEFNSIYPNESACLRYLHDLKWGNGFKCKKCNHDQAVEGKDLFSMRCTKCNYLESVTSNTLFHGLKFPIQKAFYILFSVITEKNNLTMDELTDITGVRRNTCWSFKQKIMTRAEELEKKGKEPSWKNIILNEE